MHLKDSLVGKLGPGALCALRLSQIGPLAVRWRLDRNQIEAKESEEAPTQANPRDVQINQRCERAKID